MYVPLYKDRQSWAVSSWVGGSRNLQRRKIKSGSSINCLAGRGVPMYGRSLLLTTTAWWETQHYTPSTDTAMLHSTIPTMVQLTKHSSQMDWGESAHNSIAAVCVCVCVTHATRYTQAVHSLAICPVTWAHMPNTKGLLHKGSGHSLDHREGHTSEQFVL